MKIFPCIFSLLLLLNSFGQTSKDTIIAEDFNPQLLDSLIFEEINQARLDSNLAKLFYSDSLDAEASSHAEFMTQQQTIVYSKEGKKAGECNSKTFYRNVSKITYREYAKRIVQQWLASKGHAKLLLGEFFLYGGCGVSWMEWKSVNEMYVYVCFRISYWP